MPSFRLHRCCSTRNHRPPRNLHTQAATSQVGMDLLVLFCARPMVEFQEMGLSFGIPA